MPLPENDKAVQEVLAVLNPRVLGRELPGWSCCCGAVKGSAAIATEIKPSGYEFPGQEANPILWTVRMQPKQGEPDNGWSCGLRRFISKEELEDLFAKHFGEQFAKRLKRRTSEAG